MSKRAWEAVEESIEILFFGKGYTNGDDPKAEVTPVCPAPPPPSPKDPS